MRLSPGAVRSADVAASCKRRGYIRNSSTESSSRNCCSGPNPETSATIWPTTSSGSSSERTAPVRLRDSCSAMTSRATWRTDVASVRGSMRRWRTRSRTRSDRADVDDSTPDTSSPEEVTWQEIVPNHGTFGKSLSPRAVDAHRLTRHPTSGNLEVGHGSGGLA